MKVRNKKTGEIADIEINSHRLTIVYEDGRVEQFFFDSLKDLDGWEDYEESKEHWCITMYGGIVRIEDDEEPVDDLKEIGNYFNSKEDAYDALDKLKAWKRLKDKGFEFINFPYKKICKYDARTGVGNLEYQVKYYEELEADLDLLFGGKE